MKKPLFATLGVAIAYTGAAWYTGYVGEQKFREQLELTKQQPASVGMQLDLVKYERGIFTSQVELVIKPLSELPLELVRLTSRAQHGPVLFGDGLGFGLYDMTSRFQLQLRDEQMNKDLQAALGDKLGDIHSRVYFDASYDGSWGLDALAKEEDGTSLSMQPSQVNFSGRLDSLSGEAQIKIGAINAKLADGSHIDVAEISGSVQVENLEPGVNLTNMTLTMPEVKGANGQGVAFSLEGLSLAQLQTLNNNKIDTQVKLDMVKLVGPVVVEKAYYHISFNQVDKAALKAINESMSRAAGVTDPEALQMVYLQVFTEALPLLLQEGLSAQLSLGAEFMGGKSEAVWNTRYVPPADGKTLTQLQGLEEYLQLVDSDLSVKAPAGLLQATPASTMVGTYLQEENGNYLLKASFKAGELVIGNTTVPPEQWMTALVGMSAMAQAGQEPAAGEADAYSDTDAYADADAYEGTDAEAEVTEADAATE